MVNVLKWNRKSETRFGFLLYILDRQLINQDNLKISRKYKTNTSNYPTLNIFKYAPLQSQMKNRSSNLEESEADKSRNMISVKNFV